MDKVTKRKKLVKIREIELRTNMRNNDRVLQQKIRELSVQKQLEEEKLNILRQQYKNESNRNEKCKLIQNLNKNCNDIANLYKMIIIGYDY